MIGEMAGSYRIVSPLGEGGMGVVYNAEHPLLHRRAVVKMLLPALSARTDIVERFFNEARASTLIKHPGIVDIFDFGYHPSGSAFIVMELLEGESLAARLEKRRRLTPREAVSITRQLASALGAAHERGIVHRDLKPDNLFLVPDPDMPGGERVKILDFGIAKLGPAQASLKTHTGAVMGTPAYMSPEQCQSTASVDARADIYAVGCILYEMVCGRPPFLGEGIAQVVAAHMFETPVPPSHLVADVGADLEGIILRALAKSPAHRQPTCEVLMRELGSLPSQGAEAMPAGSFAGSPAGPRAYVESTTLGYAASPLVTAPSLRRPRALGFVIGAVAVVAVAALAAMALQQGGAGSATEPSGAARAGAAADALPPPDAAPPDPASVPQPESRAFAAPLDAGVAAPTAASTVPAAGFDAGLDASAAGARRPTAGPRHSSGSGRKPPSETRPDVPKPVSPPSDVHDSPCPKDANGRYTDRCK